MDYAKSRLGPGMVCALFVLHFPIRKRLYCRVSVIVRQCYCEDGK